MEKNNKINVFAYLKHLWKDPINDMEEAKKRKKQVLPFFLVPFGLFLVLAFLSGVFDSDTLMTISMISGMVSCIPAFLLWMIFKIERKFKDIFCDKCKTRMENGDNISYKVLGIRETRSQQNGSITITTYTNIKFDCKCQNCGAKKTFTHEFKATNSAVSPEVFVEEYFGNIIR